MNILELTTCGTTALHFSITLPHPIGQPELHAMGRGRVVVENHAFSPPHFKIVDKNFVMRGAVGSPRMSAQFNSNDKQLCRKMLDELEAEAGFTGFAGTTGFQIAVGENPANPENLPNPASDR